ncbi:hypothetical protein CPB83DRAFT_857932 [Crepidotus variabilis]|uniref:Fe2OG dioxygenase domain-containing protein n=1 Tax=Crepidotus variabilis TaxID=179855 RepID=A0A9P6ECE3_9AGAR|nr:hypothetical protein CPB83DRAFT_857932 [Crepidotus variabilis]
MERQSKPQKISKQKEEESDSTGKSEAFRQVTSSKFDAFKIQDMPDCDVYYVPSLVTKKKSDEWYTSLLELDSWYQPTLKVYGKEVTQSRKIAAYSTDPKLTLKYSGQTVDMKYEYPLLLRTIQDEVEEYLGVKFNHVMLNLYEDGTVYIGNHRDNPENKVIASLSLGAERTFVMTHDSKTKKTIKKAATTELSTSKKGKRKAETLQDSTPSSTESSVSVLQKRWILGSGSLVIMQGDTQKFWKHEIPKEAKIKGGRISLTFRQLVNL